MSRVTSIKDLIWISQATANRKKSRIGCTIRL